MLLEVKNVKTEFKMKKGMVKAVNDVSFQCEKGEILAIVGESGSGKSVTSLSIMGLLARNAKVTEGEILFKGENLLDKSASEMRAIRGNQISMIFQEPMTSLNPVLRIGDQLTESIILHMKLSKQEAMQRAVEMLELVGIPSPSQRVKDYPHQMSGGMRQRVMIAMALACNPELLIADEPTTALDVTIQAQILDIIYRLREKLGMAVLLITHDLGVVAEAADRVVVMYCGKVVEEAKVEELFEKPLHPYTMGLLASIPRADEDKEKLYMIKGMVPNPMNMPAGCAFSDRCEKCMSICKEQEPAIREKDGRKVRCHLYTNDLEVIH
ncbi:peptide ABC transporter ATP-binding protein [Sporanaerobium hydrogeniformans]|uniref:Peptide ABC transporter ATP-binding protein n=1 Tax=Sporanaerobium hydrogeniformans TaxID=3072179 RepID=A0AC61DE30_9FIRM|nr:ABC transporter ATP-binding protein [Sporanaerobium hydrogeniformans]PHV71001.1 peptide ABC transporter ATP-binding protein [Sporanaerobium hydrogeniformans]